MAKSKGLGDTIAKVTEAIGIVPCENCNKRKEVLNKWFPYSKSLSKENYELLINNKLEGILKRILLSEIHFDTFGKRLPIEGSDDLWRGYELIFENLIKDYEENNNIE